MHSGNYKLQTDTDRILRYHSTNLVARLSNALLIPVYLLSGDVAWTSRWKASVRGWLFVRTHNVNVISRRKRNLNLHTLNASTGLQQETALLPWFPVCFAAEAMRSQTSGTCLINGVVDAIQSHMSAADCDCSSFQNHAVVLQWNSPGISAVTGRKPWRLPLRQKV